MCQLPDKVTTAAYRARNGELAWSREHIAQAIDAIRSAGFAIVGWEVWIALGNGRWHGIIPSVRGEAEIWGGDTAGREKGETWQQYCDRTAAQTLEQIESTSEEDCIADVRNRLRYNICFVPERSS